MREPAPQSRLRMSTFWAFARRLLVVILWQEGMRATLGAKHNHSVTLHFLSLSLD